MFFSNLFYKGNIPLIINNIHTHISLLAYKCAEKNNIMLSLEHRQIMQTEFWIDLNTLLIQNCLDIKFNKMFTAIDTDASTNLCLL